MTRLLRIKMAVAGVLGHFCQICHQRGAWPWEKTGIEYGFPALQVGHVNGRKWSIRRANQITRWLRYLWEALRSPRWCKKTHRLIPWVQAECGPCNRKHGGGLRYKGKPDRTRQGAKRQDMKISRTTENQAAQADREFLKAQMS